MPPEQSKKKFDYPYVLDFNDETQAYSLTVKLSANEVNFIKGMRLRQGTLTVVTAHLFHKLVNELQRKGIRDFTNVDEFEQLVLTSKLVDAAEYDQLLCDSTELNAIRTGGGAGGGLSHGTAGGAMSESGTLNERKRTSGVRAKHKEHASKLSDVQGNRGKGGE